jgi:hypothetical protein
VTVFRNQRERSRDPFQSRVAAAMTSGWRDGASGEHWEGKDSFKKVESSGHIKKF